MTRSKFHKITTIIFPFFLFGVAFLPRSIYLVARSLLWHDRANEFIAALENGDWAGTLLAPHPGVITMWLAGIAHWIAAIFDPEFESKRLHEQMSVELIPLALVIALCIVLAYFLLRRIFDQQIAAVSALLLALDPFHIYVSKTLHVDSMVSVFAMISALFMLVYVFAEGGRRWRMVILSGIFAGLAILSKLPGLFIVPYVALGLGVGELIKSWPVRKWRDWWRVLAGMVPVFAVWLGVMTVVFFLLWPSMWVQPLESLALNFNRTVDHVTTPHQNPLLFLGEITLDDPGLLFYPFVIVISATVVTSVGFLASAVALFQRRLSSRHRQALWLILAFLFFFTVQMSLGEKKAERYILPGFQFLVIVAGFGLTYLVRWVAGNREWLRHLLIVTLVGWQMSLVIAYHPYYGTYYNGLVGGIQAVLGRNMVAGQEQGEGLDLAAAYLNQLPAAQLLSVGAQIHESFFPYFWGKSESMVDDNVDYLVFSRNWVVRDMEKQYWASLWESYKEREPKHVVEFDGIPFVWVYKVGPIIDETAVEHVINARFGDDIILLGYDLEPEKAQVGETINLTLYWEAVNLPVGDYSVFTHLLDSNGQLISQQDNQPQNGMYPTNFWDAGERVQDKYVLTVVSGSPPGDYTIAVGLYTLQTLQRLPVTDAIGNLQPDGQMRIEGFEILP